MNVDSASPQMVDNLIYIVIVLSILSVITERVTQFIRMYPIPFRMAGLVVCTLFLIPLYTAGKLSINASASDHSISLIEVCILLILDLGGIVLFLAHSSFIYDRISSGNTPLRIFQHIKKSSIASEEVKVRELTLLSFIVGFCIAYLINANLFSLLIQTYPHLPLRSSSPFILLERSSVYTLNPTFFGFDFTSLTGYLFTSLLLSFGSKFFHDLVEAISITKKIKRTFVIGETSAVDSTHAMDDVLKLTNKDIVNLAIAQHEVLLKRKFNNISYLNDSIAIVHDRREIVVGIYLTDDNSNEIPSQLPVTVPGGKQVFVPTEIIPFSGLAVVTIGIEGSLYNYKCPMYRGSACSVVKDSKDKSYLLTNCHVLTEGRLEDKDFNVSKDEVFFDGESVGEWYYGTMDKKGDFALVALEDASSWVDECNYQSYKSMRSVGAEDVLSLKVNTCGQATKTREGYIVDIVHGKTGILYSYGKSIVFDTVILVADSINRKTCKPITKHGDSGGALYDDQHQLIGIITGMNEKFTYVIPVTDFLSNLNLKLA